MKSNIKGFCLPERKKKRKRKTRKLLKCVIFPVLFALKHFDVHNKCYLQKNFSVPVLKGLVGSFSKPKSWINIPKHALSLCSMSFWDKYNYWKAALLLDQKHPLSMFWNHSAREIYQNLVWIRMNSALR